MYLCNLLACSCLRFKMYIILEQRKLTCVGLLELEVINFVVDIGCKFFCYNLTCMGGQSFKISTY